MTDVELLQAEIKATLRELRITRDPVRRTALNEDLADLAHELLCALKVSRKAAARFADWDDSTVHRGNRTHTGTSKSRTVSNRPQMETNKGRGEED